MKTATRPPVSNAETYTDNLEFYDDATGDPWFTVADTAGWPTEITIKLRDRLSGETAIEGSYTDGDLVMAGDGVMTFTFSADDMEGINPGTYEIGCLYSNATTTRQVILGLLPVLKGL